MTTFDDWPWQYSFPPFFTVQPNLQTRKKQLLAWCDLVLKFHKATNQYVLDIREAQSSPLFHNADINRKLSVEGIAEVMNEMQKRSNAEPLDKAKNRWHILWHTLDEWASILYSWADDTGSLDMSLDNNLSALPNFGRDIIVARLDHQFQTLIFDIIGQLGGVCTFFEITSTPGKEFSGIDQDVLLKALRRLEQRKKAEVIHMDDGNGVKFF